MANTGLVLAGTGATGASGASLLWVAPLTGTGTTAPTDGSTALGSGWKDCGYISTDGVTVNFSETVKDINAYGVEPPVRELVTNSKETFDATFLETNTTVLEMFYRLALSSITVTSGTGAMTVITTGPARVVFFQIVIDMVDGSNHWRTYAPKAQVTDRKGFQIQAGTELSRGMTLTVYPDNSGNATYNYPIIPILG